MQTPDVIKSGNKIIAEFEGHRYSPFEFNHKYHNRWDVLKPVIQKIYDWYNNDSDALADEYEKANLRILELRIYVGIEEAWQAVVAFIQWYNTQQQNITDGK